MCALARVLLLVLLLVLSSRTGAALRQPGPKRSLLQADGAPQPTFEVSLAERGSLLRAGHR
jgi:hypothetical protein